MAHGGGALWFAPPQTSHALPRSYETTRDVLFPLKMMDMGKLLKKLEFR